jgi:hypothetical protein
MASAWAARALAAATRGERRQPRARVRHAGFEGLGLAIAARGGGEIAKHFQRATFVEMRGRIAWRNRDGAVAGGDGFGLAVQRDQAARFGFMQRRIAWRELQRLAEIRQCGVIVPLLQLEVAARVEEQRVRRAACDSLLGQRGGTREITGLKQRENAGDDVRHHR